MQIMGVNRKTAIKNDFILQAWPMKFWVMRKSARNTIATGASHIMRISINSKKKDSRERMKSTGVSIMAKSGSG